MVATRSVRIAVSLALAALLLALFLWNVDLSAVGEAVADADGGLLTAAAVLALVSYWLRAVRWQLILRPAGRVRHSSAVLATAVGYATMALLPARLGDLVRPVVLARREPLPTSAALASILTERIFDLWTVVAFFLISVLWPPEMSGLTAQARANLALLGRSGALVGAGLAAGTLILLGLFRYQERFVAIVTRPLARFRWRAPVEAFLRHFLDGLRVIQRPRDLAATAGMSALVWLVIYLQVDVTLAAFGVDLPLRASYLLVAVSVIGLAVPTPGGIGGFHKAAQVGLTLFFAVELSRATAFAIVHHAICFIPITILGLLCLPVLGMSLRGLGSVEETR